MAHPMLEIPPSKDTDAEDVVWGLQTAETLWKRGERVDALVWVRRAAQAANDANDDHRALELARRAAELTDWVAKAHDGSVTDPPIDLEVALVSAADEGRPSTMSVLPAEKVHAGMFDPWADQGPKLEGRSAPAPAPPPPPASAPAPPPARRSVVDPGEEEIITSVRPQMLSRPGLDSVSVPVVAATLPPTSTPRSGVPSKPAPKAPPPLPPRARPPLPKPPLSSNLAPALPAEGATTPPPQERLRAAADSAPAAAQSAPAVEPSLAAESARVDSKKLDLDNAEAFADLPDDARISFAAAAQLDSLAEGEEIGNFALAYVVSGAFDVAATVVDAPAVRLTEGAVLRARGTMDENVPIRLICATDSGIIATWSDASVDHAFRTIPWVEDDLRAAADRVQTLVGITIGPLGERLDVSIREEIVARLTMRPLIPGEVVVRDGEPVPGLLLVGIGELELVNGEKVLGNVGSGDFLFPTEVLGAGLAPATARAGVGGALVLFGDRQVAQELLVTCPPLLEVLAGM